MAQPDEHIQGDDIKKILMAAMRLMYNGETDQLEEGLRNLEEYDPNFHKYSIVKRLMKRINISLGGYLGKEIEKSSLVLQNSRQESTCNRILKEIVLTEEYKSLLKSVQIEVQKSCENLLATEEEDLIDAASPQILYSETDSSYEESSLNQSGFTFLDAAQIRLVAGHLSAKYSNTERESALSKLLNSPYMDEHNVNAWSDIKEMLPNCLAHPNNAIWELTLKLLSRNLCINRPYSHEAYTILIKYVHIEFSKSQSFLNSDNVFKCDNLLNLKLIKVIRVVNEYQQRIASLWQRFPQDVIYNIIDSTLSLFDFQYENEINPLHLFALVDVQAAWFCSWMHGHLSRSVVIELVSKCMQFQEFVVKSVLKVKVLRPRSGRVKSARSRDQSRFCYSKNELDYILFVHCMKIFGRLSCFKSGREIFPVAVPRFGSPLNISDIIIKLIQTVRSRDTQRFNITNNAVNYCAGNLVLELLKSFCCSESVMRANLCHPKVIDELVEPVKKILEVSGNASHSEESLLLIPSVLCSMASTELGRDYLLATENGRSACGVVATFTQRTLTAGQLAAPQTVTANFVYFCHLLYRTCRGLRHLQQFHLHSHIASAVRQAAEGFAVGTHTIDSPGRVHRFACVEVLQESLLGFCSTPYGVLLLCKTQLLDECVAFMRVQQIKDIENQEEQCEYDLVVNQLSCTIPGSQALHNHCFTAEIVRKVWKALEVVDDTVEFSPPVYCAFKMSPYTQQIFLELMNFLSSFPGVVAHLGSSNSRVRPSDVVYTFRDTPTSLLDLFERLVMCDTEAKMHSLFNYEDSHYFGLRLLLCLCSNLDISLYLQSTYKFQEFLLKSQKESFSGDNLIIDCLSITRSRILHKSGMLGGPSEKVELTEDQILEGTAAMIHSLPLPEWNLDKSTKKAPELHKELSILLGNSSTDSPRSKLKDSILTSLQSTGIPSSTCCSILERVMEELDNEPKLPAFNIAAEHVRSARVSDFVIEGTKLVLNYGHQLRQIKNTSASTTDFHRLCEIVNKAALKKQSLVTVAEMGFDWFSAVIFIIMYGNLERTVQFLTNFSQSFTSAFLWSRRAFVMKSFQESQVDPLFSCICHAVESILPVELPLVSSALTSSQLVSSKVCLLWIRQCFLNVLDWPEICHFLIISVSFGYDHIVYTCLALFQHLEEKILQRSRDGNLSALLLTEPIKDFKFKTYIQYMKELESHHKKSILAELQSIIEQ